MKSFKILKKCVTEYDAKIQEALLIKKLNPKLNKQLYQGYLEHRDRLLCLFRTFRLTTVVLRSAFRLTIGRLNDR